MNNEHGAERQAAERRADADAAEEGIAARSATDARRAEEEKPSPPAADAADAADNPSMTPATGMPGAALPGTSLPGAGQPAPQPQQPVAARPVLTLSATVPPKPSVTAPEALTAVGPDVPVRFIVKATAEIPVPSLMSGSERIEARFVNETGTDAATEWVANVPFKTQPAHDVYATVGEGVDAVESAAMRITVTGSAGQTTPGGEVGGPAEVSVGEYDPDFARRTGGVFRGLAFVFAGLAAWMLLWILPMGGLAAEETDITDRIVAAAGTIVLTVGVIAILAGVYMAMMEARGRQRARVVLTETGTRGGGLGMSVEDVEKLAKALSKVRGTIAALVIGVVLIVAGLTALTLDQVVPEPAGTSQTEDPGSGEGEDEE